MSIQLNLPKDPVLPGSKMTIKVNSDQDLLAMLIKIRDPNENLRMIYRNKGNNTILSTIFPKTNLLEPWHIEVIGYTSDYREINLTDSLKINNEKTAKVDLYTYEENINEIETIGKQDENPKVDENTKQEPEELDITDTTESEREVTEPLTVVNGIGNATEKKLLEAGYRSINDIANSTVEKLGSIGIQESQAHTIIENSKLYLSNSKDNKN